MRIEQLTFTRFIAAISIVIFHFGDGCYLFNNEYVSFLFTQANMGVSYFFILSGFVMTIAYSHKEDFQLKEYLVNRIGRIYPLYFFSIVLVLLAIPLINVDKYALLQNLLMMQSWFPDRAQTLNYPGWSLSVEMFFYLLFPLLLNKVYVRFKFQTKALWIISFWLLSQLIFQLILLGDFHFVPYSSKDMHYHPLLHLNEFLMGHLTGLAYLKTRSRYQKNYLPIILLLSFVLILLLKFPVHMSFHNGLLAIIFAPLILLISLSKDRITTFFSKPVFVFLGEISFAIYLLQLPVWLIFTEDRMEKYLGFDREIDFTKSFMVRFLILMILSALSYVYFEKPIRKVFNKLLINN